MITIWGIVWKAWIRKQPIRILRSRNDNDCLIIKNADTTAKVVIKTIELKVLILN